MSADLVRTDSPESCGQRMRHSMPLRPKRLRLKAALLRDVDEDRRAVAVRAQLDPGVVDEPLGLLVVRDQLDLDASLGGRVDLDVAVREPHVELDRALDFECLLHLRLL